MCHFRHEIERYYCMCILNLTCSIDDRIFLEDSGTEGDRERLFQQEIDQRWSESSGSTGSLVQITAQTKLHEFTVLVK